MTPALNIIARVSAEHGLQPRDLKSQTRKRCVAWPRQQAMAELRALGLSWHVIARILGGRDHSTIIYGVRQYERRTGGRA